MAITLETALKAAERGGHKMEVYKTTQMGNDRRVTHKCVRCGSLLIEITQGKSVEVNGTVHEKACPQWRKLP